MKAGTLEMVCDAVFEGSGMALKSIDEINFQVVKYAPLRGGSYIKCPSYIVNKRAVLNVQNRTDELCFKWAILSALCKPTGNITRVSAYRSNSFTFVDRDGETRHETINFDGLTFPMPLENIKIFEQINPNISVNVFGYSNDNVFLLRGTRTLKKHHVRLLFLQEPVESATGVAQEPMVTDIDNDLNDEEKELAVLKIMERIELDKDNTLKKKK